MEKCENIIKKAKELAVLIENHGITVRYRESLEKMNNDVAAQKILSELIRIGGEIKNNNGSNDGSSYGKAELEILKDEFEKNGTVRDHILIQREYLDFIKTVQDRIKNPQQ